MPNGVNTLVALDLLPEVKDRTASIARFTEVGKRFAAIDLGGTAATSFVAELAAKKIVVDPTMVAIAPKFTTRAYWGIVAVQVALGQPEDTVALVPAPCRNDHHDLVAAKDDAACREVFSQRANRRSAPGRRDRGR